MLRKLIVFILCLLVVVIGILLGATNQQLTELNLLIVKLELRVVDIAVIFLLVGLLLGVLISSIFVIQRKIRRRSSNSPVQV